MSQKIRVKMPYQPNCLAEITVALAEYGFTVSVDSDDEETVIEAERLFEGEVVPTFH